MYCIKNKYILSYLLLIFFLINQCFANQLYDLFPGLELKDYNPKIYSIRNEYKNIKKYPRNSAAKEKIAYMAGFVSVNKTNSPILYDSISSLCNQLNLETPVITVFKGNIVHDILCHTPFGSDIRINAFASGIPGTSRKIICIGQDLINRFTYEELQAVVAHEIGHIYKRHGRKRLILNLILNSILTLSTKLIPFTPIWGLDCITLPLIGKINCHPTNLVMIPMFDVIRSGVSRNHEREADLFSYELTGDYKSLISGLNKIHEIYEEKHPYIYQFHKLQEKIMPWNSIYHSHPSNKKREKHLERIAKENEAVAILQANPKLAN